MPHRPAKGRKRGIPCVQNSRCARAQEVRPAGVVGSFPSRAHVDAAIGGMNGLDHSKIVVAP